MSKINLDQPTPAQVRAARERVGLTQLEAGALVHVTYETWRSWEAEEGTARHRKMPLGLWELFQRKAPRSRPDE